MNAKNDSTQKPQIGVIMGSQSDWDTMQHAIETLEKLEIAYEKRIVSAHRTPDLVFEYAKTAEQTCSRLAE